MTNNTYNKRMYNGISMYVFRRKDETNCVGSSGEILKFFYKLKEIISKNLK